MKGMLSRYTCEMQGHRSTVFPKNSKDLWCLKHSVRVQRTYFGCVYCGEYMYLYLCLIYSYIYIPISISISVLISNLYSSTYIIIKTYIIVCSALNMFWTPLILTEMWPQPIVKLIAMYWHGRRSDNKEPPT